MGLIGFLPIVIGIKELLELHRKNDDDDKEDIEKLTKHHLQRKK
jgi:cadmium resistance protein CadD (predicted permease)